MLKEAERHEDGRRLGVVGSTIVGEVLGGLLELDSGSWVNREPQWQPGFEGTPLPDFDLAALVAHAQGI